MDVPIYGRISALRLFTVAGEETERLFLLTEKYRFAVLKFDPATGMQGATSWRGAVMQGWCVRVCTRPPVWD